MEAESEAESDEEAASSPSFSGVSVDTEGDGLRIKHVYQLPMFFSDIFLLEPSQFTVQPDAVTSSPLLHSGDIERTSFSSIHGGIN